MSIFDRFFKRKEPKEPVIPDLLNDITDSNDFTYVLKTAEFISGNDKEVLEKIKECIDNTAEFVEKNRERYLLWAVEPDLNDKETLVLTGFIDELSDAGYIFTTDTAAEFDDFIDGIKALATFKSMEIDISYIKFNQERNTLDWCRAINEELRDIRQLCCIDIGGEDLNLVWLNNETILDIAAAVENTEISIEAVGIKQY